jgi:hypothetical protein
MIVQHLGQTGTRWRLYGCGFLDCWFDNFPFNRLAIFALQFSDPQIEAFDFFEGDQVYFTEEFDDPGLIRVHAELSPEERGCHCRSPGDAEVLWAAAKALRAACALFREAILTLLTGGTLAVGFLRLRRNCHRLPPRVRDGRGSYPKYDSN